MTIPKSYGKSFFNEKATFFDGIDVTTIESGEITSETLTVGINDINNQVVVTSTGSVGIRTDTPGSALDVQGNIRVRDTVGIGTTNPTAKLEPVDTAANPTVAPVVFIQRPNNILPASIAPTNADLRIKSHSSNVKIYAEDHSANPLMILTGGGNLGIGTADPKAKLHVSGGNIKVDNGFGIDFSSTSDSSGTMSNELLDDYEEGTWTPTLVATTTAGTGTYSTQTGRYTKIGNIVYVQAVLAWSAHTGSGNMTISGLPFNNGTGTGFAATGTISVADMTSPAGSYVTVILPSGASTININSIVTATGVSAALALDTSASFRLSLTYQTS